MHANKRSAPFDGWRLAMDTEGKRVRTSPTRRPAFWNLWRRLEGFSAKTVYPSDRGHSFQSIVGQGRGFGGECRRFFSGVHDESRGQRFCGRRHRAFRLRVWHSVNSFRLRSPAARLPRFSAPEPWARSTSSRRRIVGVAPNPIFTVVPSMPTTVTAISTRCKGIGWYRVNAQFGTFDIECTGRPNRV